MSPAAVFGADGSNSFFLLQLQGRCSISHFLDDLCARAAAERTCDDDRSLHCIDSHALLLGDYETSGHFAKQGLDIWRSGGAQSAPEEVDVPAGACLRYDALLKWHSGETASAQAT